MGNSTGPRFLSEIVNTQFSGINFLILEYSVTDENFKNEQRLMEKINEVMKDVKELEKFFDDISSDGGESSNEDASIGRGKQMEFDDDEVYDTPMEDNKLDKEIHANDLKRNTEAAKHHRRSTEEENIRHV